MTLGPVYIKTMVERMAPLVSDFPIFLYFWELCQEGMTLQ
eukprot:CAMPEP_0171332830 /NCGR_PEP_ID=MMETSP0878-20121228/3634_1 /TAXON_ID=67004 /ORGANISM="Thalassiosira weissflogii, Strain CCMP1336" /LENGTH=39 /DNA_ID= /DNA_START= /DNA_END= /DNA_ORIENTATION=